MKQKEFGVIRRSATMISPCRAAAPLKTPSGQGAGGIGIVDANDAREVDQLVKEDPFWPTGLRKSVRYEKPADIYPALLKAFNAGDIDATVACYEPQACFMLKSGHAARGTTELREMYRATFSYKPDLKLDVRKVISVGDDLVLVVVEWTSKTVSSSGDAKVWTGTATDIVRRQPDGTWKLALDNPYGIE